MTVNEVMSVSPACCTQDTRLEDVARMMLEHDCGAIPVMKDDQSRMVVGIVTDRDIVCRVLAHGKNPLQCFARDCMSQPAITIRADATVDACVDLLERHMIRRVPVVDDSGRCIGMVAQADIARAASKGRTAELVKEVSQPGPGPESGSRVH
jgi:CBS domain-containing protein